LRITLEETNAKALIAMLETKSQMSWKKRLWREVINGIHLNPVIIAYWERLEGEKRMLGYLEKVLIKSLFHVKVLFFKVWLGDYLAIRYFRERNKILGKLMK